MTVPHKIIAELKRIRLEMRISQDAIGAALGLAQGHVSKYEAGLHRPRADLVYGWAEQLGYELVLQPKVTT